jgi:hypothetical protein
VKRRLYTTALIATNLQARVSLRGEAAPEQRSPRIFGQHWPDRLHQNGWARARGASSLDPAGCSPRGLFRLS